MAQSLSIPAAVLEDSRREENGPLFESATTDQKERDCAVQAKQADRQLFVYPPGGGTVHDSNSRNKTSGPWSYLPHFKDTVKCIGE